MHLFPRYGYSRALKKQLGLEFPDVGNHRPRNLSFPKITNDILDKMANYSGFSQSAIFYSYGEYLKIANIYKIPVANARAPGTKEPSEGAALLYDIFQNRAELNHLTNYYFDPSFPKPYTCPIHKQFEALNSELLHLGQEAGKFARRESSAVASILGLLAGLAITVTVSIAAYLLFENWSYLSQLDPFHHVVAPIAFFCPPLLLVGLSMLRSMRIRMFRCLAWFKSPRIKKQQKTGVCKTCACFAFFPA